MRVGDSKRFKNISGHGPHNRCTIGIKLRTPPPSPLWPVIGWPAIIAQTALVDFNILQQTLWSIALGQLYSHITSSINMPVTKANFEQGPWVGSCEKESRRS